MELTLTLNFDKTRNTVQAASIAKFLSDLQEHPALSYRRDQTDSGNAKITYRFIFKKDNSIDDSIVKFVPNQWRKVVKKIFCSMKKSSEESLVTLIFNLPEGMRLMPCCIEKHGA